VNHQNNAQLARFKINYLMGFVPSQLALHHVQDALKVNAMNATPVIYSLMENALRNKIVQRVPSLILLRIFVLHVVTALVIAKNVRELDNVLNVNKDIH
jgi:hypothetical protein